MALNFYISFSGIVTFKKALALKEVAQHVPLERMLIETDSPYLAPVPYRGKTNEPAYVRHVAEEIARLRGISLEEVGAATTQNFFDLFQAAQALREKLTRVDAVLYTHYHADHLNGLDDLRSFCHLQRQPIPVYGNEATLQGIVQRFGYAFPHHEQHHWDKPVLKAHTIDAPFIAGGVEVIPVPVMHGKYEILAYRIGNMAYLTDVSDISAASMEKLQGLDCLLLDCLRYRPHPTHFSLAEALAWAEKIGARETWLIHMTHELEYSELNAQLPAGIRPAYDGLHLQC